MNNSENSEDEIIFSVIIPIMVINDYLRETCEYLKRSKNKKFEVLIVSNSQDQELVDLIRDFRGKVISAGDVSPAIKRDKGAEKARGKYLAFIDDDAYPNEDWLDVAEKYLENEEVVAVGGPQLTPPDNTFWQKASGAMFVSPLSGVAVIRFWPGKKIQKVDDWPTVNFIVKKKDFDAIGGFDNKYWPGEDTKLCLDIIKKIKKKIIYVPNLVVHHHRRGSLKKHLKQIGNYGKHRGYFAKVFPENSMKIASLYFVPSLFVLYLFFGVLSFFIGPMFWKLYLLGLIIYGLAVILSTLVIWQRTKNFLVSLATIPYLVLFHIWYGIRFIQGFFFTKNLKSKLGR